MNQDDAFLHDVCEHPDDDGPRLVYADWLEDHGDPDRAAFIRVQCALARTDEYDPARPGLEKQEKALLDQHGDEWRQLPPKWARKDSQFRRGFVAEVVATADQFLAGADDLWRRAPVEGLHLKRAGGHEQALVASPHLNRLAFLGLHDATVILALAGSSPHLQRLAFLTLDHIRCDQETLPVVLSLGPALAASPNLPALTALRLDVPGGNLIVEALATAPQRAGLLSLDCSAGSCMGDYSSGVLALAAATCLPNLSSLDMRGHTISVDGCAPWRTPPPCPGSARSVWGTTEWATRRPSRWPAVVSWHNSPS